MIAWMVKTRTTAKGPSEHTEPMVPMVAPVPAVQARSRISTDRLVQAGLGILSDGGADALTMSAVALRAGLAVGTVYRRFGDKERLLAALLFHFIQTVDADIDRYVRNAQRSAVNDAQRVSAAVQGVSRSFERHERLLGVFLVLGLTNSGVLAEGTRASKIANRRFCDSVNEVTIAHANRDAALDMAYRTVYAACAHRVTHGDTHESDRALPWRSFHKQLAHMVQRYLLPTIT